MPAGRAPFAILLPPSEGKDAGGAAVRWDPDSGTFGPALGDHRRRVVGALARAAGGDQRLLGVGGVRLKRARAANTQLLDAATLSAAERYSGVVWQHLDVGSLRRHARLRAMDSIVVVSGLLGLVQLGDLTPDYRLKMGASLAPLGRLSTWWRPALTAALEDWLDGRFVVDLLPNEHRAALGPGRGNGVAVTFVDRTGQIAGHDAKAAKGRLARHLITSSSAVAVRTSLRRWTDDRFALRVEER